MTFELIFDPTNPPSVGQLQATTAPPTHPRGRGRPRTSPAARESGPYPQSKAGKIGTGPAGSKAGPASAAASASATHPDGCTIQRGSNPDVSALQLLDFLGAEEAKQLRNALTKRLIRLQMAARRQQREYDRLAYCEVFML